MGKFKKGFIKITQLEIGDALILHPADVGDLLFMSQMSEPGEGGGQKSSVARTLRVVNETVFETDRRFRTGKDGFVIRLDKDKSSAVFRVSHHA